MAADLMKFQPGDQVWARLGDYWSKAVIQGVWDSGKPQMNTGRYPSRHETTWYVRVGDIPTWRYESELLTEDDYARHLLTL